MSALKRELYIGLDTKVKKEIAQLANLEQWYSPPPGDVATWFPRPLYTAAGRQATSFIFFALIRRNRVIPGESGTSPLLR